MIFVYRTSAVSRETSIGDIDVETEILLNENGAQVNYIIVNQGKPGDMYDDSCDGTWLLRKDIAENRQWNSSNSNDYANSTVNAYLNGDWLNRYDPDVAEAIKQVKIPYCVGGESEIVNSGASGLSTKSFLLSAKEVGFNTIDSFEPPEDGIILDYFVSGEDSLAKQKRIATLNGEGSYWWLRTTMESGLISRVSSSGTGGTWLSNSSYGLRPCIILPFDFKLTSDQIVGVS